MDRFLLTLLVTVEQEYAIQKLFWRHGWLYSRIVGEKCSTKSPIASIQMPSETQLLTSTECCLPENTHVKVEDSQTELDGENTNIDTASEQLTCDGTDLDIKYEIVDDENKGVGNDDHVDTRTDKSLENQVVEDRKDSTDGSKPFGQHGDDTIENPFDPVNNKTHSRTFRSSDGANLLGIGKRTLETKVEAESSKIRKTEESTDHLSNERSDYGVERNEFDVKAEVLTDKEEEELSDSLSDSEKIVTVSDKNDAETSLSHMRNIKDLQNKTNISLYYCNECHYTFTEEKYFNSHKKNGKCVFTCQFCKKEFTFKRFRAYKEHLKQHSSESDENTCGICGKRLSSRKSLKNHLIIHNKDGKYQFRCNVCDKSYITKDRLNKHIETHTGFQHLCQYCGKSFQTKYCLTRHIDIKHLNKGPYVCDKCGKVYSNRGHLLGHHAACHGETKPFKCEKCQKYFSYQKNLNYHVSKVCTKDKRVAAIHKCEICDKSFEAKRYLKQHKLIHAEGMIVCPVCGRNFRWRSSYKEHKKSCH